MHFNASLFFLLLCCTINWCREIIYQLSTVCYQDQKLTWELNHSQCKVCHLVVIGLSCCQIMSDIYLCLNSPLSTGFNARSPSNVDCFGSFSKDEHSIFLMKLKQRVLFSTVATIRKHWYKNAVPYFEMKGYNILLIWSMSYLIIYLSIHGPYTFILTFQKSSKAWLQCSLAPRGRCGLVRRFCVHRFSELDAEPSLPQNIPFNNPLIRNIADLGFNSPDICQLTNNYKLCTISDCTILNCEHFRRQNTSH